MTHLHPSLVLRTSAAFYWLVGGILGAAFVFGILVAATKAPDLWPPTLILGFLLASAMSALLSTTLALTSDAIRYRSLFVKTDVPLSDVVTVKVVVGFSNFKPYQRIVITVREKSGQKDITINTGLFDRTEIRRWIAAIDERLTGRRE
jgi:hypothetical protein